MSDITTSGGVSPASATERDARRIPAWRGLSAKFILLTIAFVMLTEVLILIPSVANFRQTALMSRLEQSRAALSILDRAIGDEMLEIDLLDALDVEMVVLRDDQRKATLAREDPMIDMIDTVYEADWGPFSAIDGAFRQVLDDDPDGLVRIVGEMDETGRQIELILRSAPIRDAILIYMRNIILISLLIAVVTALLIYLAVRALLIRPVQRMTDSMLAFARDPQAEDSVIDASGRFDEIGVAERELARMQDQLVRTLAQQRRLAELGLAVSKINHDMRNILSAAQLVTDRLADVDDPLVQRVSPRLVRAIDRAVGYSEGVLEYGRANEARPDKSEFELSSLIEDVRDVALVDERNGVTLENRVPQGFVLCGDREQLLRAFLNIARNAVQAMTTLPENRPRHLVFDAREETGRSIVEIMDTGPGVPERSRDTLFAAFGATSKRTGSGLGLAIARELIEAHGGTIRLSRTNDEGTTFEIALPSR